MGACGDDGSHISSLDSPCFQFFKDQGQNNFFGELACDIRDDQGNGLIGLD